MSVDEEPLHQLFVEDAAPVAESWRFRSAVQETLDAVRRRVFGDKGDAVTVESLDCRYRLCKIDFVFDSPSSDSHILQGVFLDGETADYPRGFGAFTAVRTYLPEGRLRTTLYLAREGDLRIPGDELDEH